LYKPQMLTLFDVQMKLITQDLLVPNVDVMPLAIAAESFMRGESFAVLSACAKSDNATTIRSAVTPRVARM
jgi:hypothetical protein